MSNDGKDYSEMSALAVLKENTGLRAQLLAAFDDCEEQSARIETRDSLIQQLHADVADLRAQLAEWKARCERRVADIHEASKRYELVLEQLRAANQRIEEAEKQEPYGYHVNGTDAPPADVAEFQRAMDCINELHIIKVNAYETRIADLERDNVELKDCRSAAQKIADYWRTISAELERKLAEQQATLDWFNSLISESYGVSGYHLNGVIAEWGEFDIPQSGAEELNKLLSEAREEGRKDSERLNFLIGNECQVWEMNRRYSVHDVTEHHPITAEYMTARDAIDAAMLAAAPSTASNATEPTCKTHCGFHRHCPTRDGVFGCSDYVPASLNAKEGRE